MIAEEHFRNKKILIVAAHPDDELLGLGATMHKWIHAYQVSTHVVILGEGITSRSEKRNPEQWQKELQIHKSNIKEAQKSIGYDSVKTFDFPDNRFDEVALLDLIKVVENEKKKFRPDIVLTHHGGDLNIDHQKTYEAVITACRPLKEEGVRTVITFETPSSTEWTPAGNISKQFQPNLFVEISEKNLQAKIDGMECYQFEKRKYPHPRSPEALKIRAQNLGSAVGCDFAEAFCIVRHVDKL